MQAGSLAFGSRRQRDGEMIDEGWPKEMFHTRLNERLLGPRCLPGPCQKHVGKQPSLWSGMGENQEMLCNAFLRQQKKNVSVNVPLHYT